MDGDSIGGSVNLVMKQAPEKLRVFGSAGGGYNQHALELRARATSAAPAGRRFDDGKVGLILSGSSSVTNRGNQDVEVIYTPTLRPQRAEPALLPGHSPARRASAAPTTSSRATTPRSRSAASSIDSSTITRTASGCAIAVANSRIDRELRDRTHIERIASLSLSGNRIVGGATTVDYQLLGAYSDQTDPLTMTTTFRRDARDLRAQRQRDVDRSGQHPGQPANDNLDNYNFNCAASGRPTSPRIATSSRSVNVRTPLQASDDRRPRS